MKIYSYLLLIVLILGGYSCNNKKSADDNKVTFPQEESELKYAKGFTVVDKGEYKLVTIKNPWQGAENIEYKYALVNNGKPLPKLDQNAVWIRTPVEKVICLSTTHIAFLDVLNETSSIIGISGKKYVNNTKVRERINRNEVYDVGYDNSLNYELIASLDPDLVITYGVGGQVAGYNQKLSDLGIQTVIVAEYLENSALGKLEWIKLMGEFYNKRAKADAYFNLVEEQYNDLSDLTDTVNNKPRVLFGLPWKDTWHVPGGKSYLAKMVEDAGGDYIWSNNDSRESIPFGIESIFALASDADVWINTGTANTKEDILKVDERFSNFKPFHKSKIYNNNRRVNQFGGSDYWETGLVEPHIILKDMIYIMHPDILPEHELEYYQIIQ